MSSVQNHHIPPNTSIHFIYIFLRKFIFFIVPDTARHPASYGHNAQNIMKTDIKEVDGGYELEIDLPGFAKDEVTAELKDGYLTISASKGLDKDE